MEPPCRRGFTVITLPSCVCSYLASQAAGYIVDRDHALDGWSERHRGIANTLFALLGPIAVIVFYLGFSGPIVSVLPTALAFSAGAFIGIALADLLPGVQFHNYDRLKLTASFAVGLLIALALGLLEPHYHQ